MFKFLLTLLFLSCFSAKATVPTTEKDALLSLYFSTAGGEWLNSWNLAGDPCDDNWFGITCNIDNDQVLVVDLSNNNLIGVLPSELGDLVNLLQLRLNSFDGGNQISGNIPPELGSLTDLVALELSGNQLSGAVPTELGNLTSLSSFYLDGNLLAGEVPASIMNMTNVLINFDYNGLFSDDPAVNNFINSQCFCTWTDSQTVAPENFQVTSGTSTSVSLSWDAVSYTQSGGYRVLQSQDVNGPFVVVEDVNDKSVNEVTVNGLSGGLSYFFQIQSYTLPHVNNLNEVVSNSSQTLFSGGCLVDGSNYIASSVADLNAVLACVNAGPLRDSIQLTADIVYEQFYDADPTYGQTALPVITTKVIIDGNNHVLSRTQPAACFNNNGVQDPSEYRMIRIDATGALALQNIIVSSGCVYGSNSNQSTYGGGIYNAGHLTIDNSIISLNRSQKSFNGGYGGGIYNEGQMIIEETSIRDNYAGNSGGGIYNDGAIMVINNSTIANNSSGNASGIYNSQIGVINSMNNITISGNTIGSGITAGMINRGNATITNSTFSENFATDSDALTNFGTLVLYNNLFDEGQGCRSNAVISGNNNISAFNNPSNSCVTAGVIDQTDLDPDTLGPLADNGCVSPLPDGTCMKTHALLDGSQAIDAGSEDAIGADQRGFILYLGQQGIRDMGAFEYHPAGVTPTADLLFSQGME